MSDLTTVCSRLGDGAASYVGAARLADLDGYWLEVHCCDGGTLFPFRLMARQRGDQVKLRDILPRLRCKRCGGSPAMVYLNETPNRTECHGGPPGWSVQLIPCPAPVVMTAEAAE